MNDRRWSSRNRSADARLALLLATAAALVGCAERRQFTIVTTPRDAVIRINGQERGRGEVRATLGFSSPQQTYRITAVRTGFEDANVPVSLGTPQGLLRVDMRPRVKPITINVEPTEAIISLDGAPLSPTRQNAFRYDLPFKLDERGQPATRTLRAERPGFASAETRISFNDNVAQYTLRLGPLKKDLLITTVPAGAHITLDRGDVGESPVTLRQQSFQYDPKTESFVTRRIIATKPGYPPAPLDIAWDDGKTEYFLQMPVYQKRVKIETDPPDVAVKLDGKLLPREADGARSIALEFPPLNEAGVLKEYTLEASLEHEGELWQPASSMLGWDEGQTQYVIKLEEILTRKVPARAIDYRVKDGKWTPAVVEATTAAMKDVTDGPLGVAKRVSDLPAGSNIQSFCLSPDGKLIAYALVEPDGNKPKSRLYMSRSDGVGGATGLTDGRQLDLTPAFNPSGDAIIFSSDRGGGPMQVWSIPVDGQSGATRLTAGTSDMLWPTLDASPKPRVFCQALVPNQDTPRIYSTQVGTIFETDLVTGGGYQPRLSPRNDSIAFVQFNAQTHKTDVLKTGDKGGVVQKMTDTPDVNERDPAWSPDGTKLAMTVEVPPVQGSPATSPQSDIYIVDSNGGNLRAVTMNEAIDDMPAWAPSGDAIYFRSNRGGKWDLWRISLK